MIMNEDFVTFELAKKLKEKGFPQRVFGTYGIYGAAYFEDGKFYRDGFICHKDEVYTAPTISQVLNWLREEKKIYIELVIVVNAEYMCDIYKIDVRPIKCLGSTEYFKTYEEAAIAGIEYVIDNLI